MENRIIIPLLCAAALAYACGPWRHAQSASAPIVTDAHATQQQHKHQVATIFNVVPQKNRGVDFALYVLNNTTKTVELKFPSGKTHDFTVLDSLGRTVWRWSDGRMFTQAMQSKAVKSRDTLSIEDSWDPRNAHGTYVAVATLNTDATPIERRIAFTLP